MALDNRRKSAKRRIKPSLVRRSVRIVTKWISAQRPYHEVEHNGLRGAWHYIAVALVVASVLHVPFFEGLFNFLDIPVQTLQGNLLADKLPNKFMGEFLNVGGIAIVKISPDVFNKRYGGTSPLDRCELLEDLKRVIGSDPHRTVAVDFGLAPPRRLSPTFGHMSNKRECECQKAIDTLLDKRTPKFILIYPFEYESETSKIAKPETSVDNDYCSEYPSNNPKDVEAKRSEIVTDWVREREKNGVLFGDYTINPEMGIVVRFKPERQQCTVNGQSQGEIRKEHFSHLLNRRLMGEVQESGLPNCSLAEKVNDVETHPIAYGSLRHFFNNGMALDTLDMRLANNSEIRHVIFGAGYAEDDTHLTPVGPRHGVDILAAIAARPTVRPGNKVFAFIVDVVIGSLIGWLASQFWHAFFCFCVPQDGRSGSYFQLMWKAFLAGSLFLLGIALVILGSMYLSLGGYWISPVAMIVGMSLDVFVLGSVMMAVSELEHRRHNNASIVAGSGVRSVNMNGTTRSRWRCLLRIGAGMIVICTIYGLIKPGF